jgi:ABC-type sugar transport system ATPase subunit
VVGVRPDDVRLDGTGKVEGTVAAVEVAGADVHVRIAVGEEMLVARVPLARRPAVGDRVRVGIEASGVHVFDAGTGARVEQ